MPFITSRGGVRSNSASVHLPEIDGLRAIAVLSVILYHFNESLLPSGFLGVDIFFVISGFVITRSLQTYRNLDPRAKLLRFFERRVKRLFPALLVCIATTALGAAVVVPNPDAFLKTAMHAVFGLSNFSLYFESKDYFGAASILDPFTQTWSLAVEEQFYLLFALLIFVEAKLGWALKAITIVFLFGSLCLLFGLRDNDPSAAFYLMPFRFWELATGVLLAWEVSKFQRFFTLPKCLPGFLLLSILIALCLPADFRIWTTIYVVICTALVIAIVDDDTTTFRFLSTKPMVAVGQVSYSLYLWHWSVITLGHWAIRDVTRPFFSRHARARNSKASWCSAICKAVTI